MFISPAYAQAAGGEGSILGSLMPLVLIFAVFWFLLIRPQQQKAKAHRAMLGAIRRGDKLVLGGGIMGKVTKVNDDDEVTVEISKDVKVLVKRALIADIIAKPEPGGKSAKEPPREQGGGSFLGNLFGGKGK
jgi:preprotein translocase subunit YajC